MTEFKAILELAKEVGLPFLFIGLVAFLCIKYIPKFIDAWQKHNEEQQIYYRNRQKQYDDQMQVIIKVAEQGNQIIARSNAIIEQNTEAIKQNTAMHDKVIGALSRDLEVLKKLEIRMETAGTGIEKLLDRSS